LRNEKAQALSGMYEVDVPEGWSIVSGAEFQAGSAADNIVISIPNDYFKRSGEIKVTPKSSTGEQYASTMVIMATNVGYYLIEKVVTVYSPTYYSEVRENNIEVVFHAPGFTHAKASSLHAPDETNDNPYGYMKIIADNIVLDVNEHGKGTFTFDATDYPYGPIAIHITAWNEKGESDDCYLQLFNYVGQPWDGGPANTAKGSLPAAIVEHGLDSKMKLVFEDEFTEMPTISYTGAGEDVKYAAAKPDPYNWPEYADAKFTPPNYSYGDVVSNYSPFSIVAGEYMKIETKDWGKVIEPNWGQTFTTGFLASMGTDGSGFVTKPGRAQYFEARLFLPPNPGLWPAFWTLTPPTPDGRCDELDILEAYMGGNPTTITFNHHEWGYHNHGSDGGYASTNDFGNGINLSEGWHTFGMLITEDMTYYYFDNQYIPGSAHPTLDVSWTVGNYFMVNNAYRQSDADKYPGGFHRYGYTAQMYVDWVRVYEEEISGFRPMWHNLKVKPGSTITIDIVRGDDVKELSGTYDIVAPNGWVVEDGTTFQAGKSKDTIILEIPQDFSEFQGFIQITPVVGDQRYETMDIKFTTEGLYSIETSLSLNEKANGYIFNLKLNNASASDFKDVVVTAEGPGGWKETKTITMVEPGKSNTVSFSVPHPSLYKLDDYAFTLKLAEDYIVTLERPMSGLVAVKAQTPITVDGLINPDEWEGAMAVELNQQWQTSGTWNGPDDLSAVAKFKWDDDYLYIALEVKDDVHHMTQSSIVNAWQADSLQLSIDPARSSGIVNGGPHLSFTAALNSDTGAYGIAVDRNDYDSVNLSWGQLLSQSKCVVTRDEATRTTVYTIALAWAEIMPDQYKDVKDLGISFLINDSDGMGRKSWIKYMDGIAIGKDPSEFGDLILADVSEMGEIIEPGEEPDEQPGEEPGEEPSEEPGEEPGGEPGEDSGEKPGEQPDEEPGEEPGEAPGEQPGEEPGEEPEKPGEEPGGEPGEDSGGKPDEEPSKEPDKDNLGKTGSWLDMTVFLAIGVAIFIAGVGLILWNKKKMIRE